MYVKRWIAFRLERFCPSSGEKNVAERMRSRAEDLLRSSTILCGEDMDKKSPYYGDAAYKQAALEEGWVRVRAPSRIEGGEVIVEVFSERDSQDVIDVVLAVARSKGHGVALSEGGPISCA